MKHLKAWSVVMLCCVFFNNIVYAKNLKRGTKSIGGSSSYLLFGNTEYDDGDTTERFKIGMTFGSLVRTNFEMGAGFEYGYNEYEYATSTTKKEFYTLAPYVTKHVPITSLSNLTFTGQVSFSKTKHENGNSVTYKTWLVSVGWEHFVSGSAAFNFSLNHEESFNDDSEVVGQESTYTNIALKLYF